MKRGYICDNCDRGSTSRDWMFACIFCGKEICGSCLYSWATCKECAAGKVDAEIQERFEREYTDEEAKVTNG